MVLANWHKQILLPETTATADIDGNSLAHG